MIDMTVKPATHYSNPRLQKATQEILAMGAVIRSNLYQVAAIISDIDATECYKSDGFDTVHQWTAAAFGIKKTASYTLLSIGREWTAYSDRLQCYKSNLVPLDVARDFTTTQVEKMLPVGHDKAKDLVYEGIITPDMTVKEISKVIKEYREEDIAEEADEAEEEQVQEETGNFVRVIDAGWAEYLIPEDVLKEYATGRSAKGIIQLQ